MKNVNAGRAYLSLTSVQFVPVEKRSWSVPWPEYCPPLYTHPRVAAGPAWADPVDPKQVSKFGTSYTAGGFAIDEDGYPVNPTGRTGVKGQGLLGRHGPNHAADPIVTRWKRLPDGGQILKAGSEPILQAVLVKRSDNGMLALPGGMVDEGETVSAAAMREFTEEAFDVDDATRERLKANKEKLFSPDNNMLVWRGYVDDPRNTDSSWMESCAFNFHDETGGLTRAFDLSAGDDASDVSWTDFYPSLEVELYASHRDMLLLAYQKLLALH